MKVRATGTGRRGFPKMKEKKKKEQNRNDHKVCINDIFKELSFVLFPDKILV